MSLRAGEGWDIHAVMEGRKLVLGGVELAHHMWLLGHSDAYALLHAITDALLGAAALGAIGTHFPDTDARFKVADSTVLLAKAARRVDASAALAMPGVRDVILSKDIHGHPMLASFMGDEPIFAIDTCAA